MDLRLPATLDMAQVFSALFVNRRAYTIQSMRPHPESGRHYYYRPKAREAGEPVELTLETVRRHYLDEYKGIVTRELVPVNGELPLPPGPGLGVELAAGIEKRPNVTVERIP